MLTSLSFNGRQLNHRQVNTKSTETVEPSNTRAHLPDVHSASQYALHQDDGVDPDRIRHSSEREDP
jgi:hypothetical protein